MLYYFRRNRDGLKIKKEQQAPWDELLQDGKGYPLEGKGLCIKDGVLINLGMEGSSICSIEKLDSEVIYLLNSAKNIFVPLK